MAMVTRIAAGTAFVSAVVVAQRARNAELVHGFDSLHKYNPQALREASTTEDRLMRVMSPNTKVWYGVLLYLDTLTDGFVRGILMEVDREPLPPERYRSVILRCNSDGNIYLQAGRR